MTKASNESKEDEESGVRPADSAEEATEKPWTIEIRHHDDVKNEHGLSNKISTTKYTLLTWLPLSLLEQFRRIANVYFLLISILMLIGTYATFLFISPLNPYSTLATLVFVLLVTSFKEGAEDLQRARSDKDENSRKVKIVIHENGQFIEKLIETQYIKAGDIIKLEGRSAVPADMVLILTSNYNDGNQCYVETANIDGETNLKLREAPAALLTSVRNGEPSMDFFTGTLEFEPPNKNIHNFIGALHLEKFKKPIALSADNILLRSSLFSNTDWAYGIAIYTGQETKIQMNNRHAASKLSKLERYLNQAILIIFLAQVTLVSFSVGSVYIMGFDDYNKLPYVYPTVFGNKGSDSILPLWLENWFVFFLLYNNFIPISLYVTIEMVNLGQAFITSSDMLMYEESLDLPCSVRSSNLCQELGMVSNIFSDKTGTLTRNEMKFVKFVVDDLMYDIPISTHNPHEVQQLKGYVLNQTQHEHDKMYQFLLCLTTCHTVIRESDGTYRAESPDELALVQGVEPFDCGIIQRGTNSMIVDMLGKRRTYEVLAVNAFNADRKRMSILLKKQVTEHRSQYILMCKGADNIMLPLCSIDSIQRKNIDKSLLDLACLGLRTLCVASKILDEQTALEWLQQYQKASSSLINRAGLLADAGEVIERDMELLGITAIEDRLQDEVPEVIAEIAQAGIVLWMLTGDKEETAVNIGYSCNLLLPRTKLFYIVKINDSVSYSNKLQEIYEDIQVNIIDDDGKKKYRDDQGEYVEIALVMDGPSFKYFDENNESHRQSLLAIGQYSRSVIACRLTPVQKQQLVALVKKDSKPRATTLSIGDGANDVSMIREADVGVGIFGKEGRQAANNSDFAVGQFKYLRRLLFIHGRMNYSRQSRVFLYCMHKNIVITLVLFWYNYYAAVSGTSMFESWVYASFNFVLGLPIVLYGIMNKDLPDGFVLTHTQVYSTGKDNTYLRISSIATWIFNAVIYATVICLIFYNVVFLSYSTFGLYQVGTAIFTALCMSLTVKVIFMHQQWSSIQASLVAGSLIGMYIFFIILASAEYDFYNEALMLYQEGIYWFFSFFSICIFTMCIDVMPYYAQLIFRPTKEMLYKEVEQNWDKFHPNTGRDAGTGAGYGIGNNLTSQSSSMHLFKSTDSAIDVHIQQPQSRTMNNRKL